MGKPVRLGVTGGIGSGKSVVCRVFAMLGAPVYDCDARARELMNTDRELIAAITDLFGAQGYVGGVLNSPYLAEKVFNDGDALARLNALVHPAVGRDFVAWVEEQAGARRVVMESAILFESGMRPLVDCVAAVSAPEELRIARTMARDGISREKVLARMEHQLGDVRREAMADRMILNDDEHSVWEQVLAIDAALTSGAGCR